MPVAKQPSPDYPVITNFRRLFLDDTPFLDVRAPIEYEKGSFPHASNLPLIDNDERHEIGICYKEDGQENAVALGNVLVSGDKKQARIHGWETYIKSNPDGVLYCFRGGMRSKISQQWLYENTGIMVPRIQGGYKALRQYLLDELEISAAELNPRVIGGRTGVGKTIVLNKLNPAIDLEGLAWHRGSAFGRHATAQPQQIDFENKLSIALLKHRANGNTPLIFEDEGRAIGSLNLPVYFHAMLGRAPLYILEVPAEERIENSVQEYIHDTLAEYIELHGEQQGFSIWAEYLHDAVDRIKRRLGGDAYTQVKTLLTNALLAHQLKQNTKLHYDWIQMLLVDYYDPMYDYQLEKKKDRIVFSGTANQLADTIFL